MKKRPTSAGSASKSACGRRPSMMWVAWTPGKNTKINGWLVHPKMMVNPSTESPLNQAVCVCVCVCVCVFFDLFHVSFGRFKKRTCFYWGFQYVPTVVVFQHGIPKTFFDSIFIPNPNPNSQTELPNLPWWRLSNRWPLESFHQPWRPSCS